MKKNKYKPIDTTFFTLLVIIVVVGVLIFISASLGILAKNEEKFYSVLANHIGLGLIGGFVAFFISSRIPYTFWKKNAFYILLGSIILTLLVFIPGIGYSHGGARRWIDVFGIFSFQPAELLKIGFVIYFAGWLSWAKQRVSDFRFGVLPLIILLSIVASILFLQPDTKSFVLMLLAGASMLFVSGVPWKYLLGVFLVGVVGIVIVFFTTPHVANRFKTFLNPASDPQGSSFQLQQSLIAIGSGGITGSGYGQSVQKLTYLPEPQGDSIFAVVGEEFGFIGSTFLILLMTAFALRGFRIAHRAEDSFARLLSVGIISIIIFQTFMNIASITGVIPLTGVPLPFVSHGGTSLLITLFAVGIVANISRKETAK